MAGNLARVWLLLCLLVLAGCASTAVPQAGSATAWLTRDENVPLPLPGLEPPLSLQQRLTGRFEGKTRVMMVMLEADAQRISLAGLAPSGISLFRLTYDAQGLQVAHSLAVSGLPPAGQVLADVMLGNWPVSAWTGHLPAGWRLFDVDGRRELRDGRDALVMEITYRQHEGQRQPVRLRHLAFDYEIVIEYADD